jgi:hypothetical protein
MGLRLGLHVADTRDARGGCGYEAHVVVPGILCNISYSNAITVHEFASECTDRNFGCFTMAHLLRDLSPVVEQNDE